MQQMRAALGEDAIIVATQETAQGVRLTAAADIAEADLAELLAPGAAPAVRDEIASCLAYHRVTEQVREKLLGALERLHPVETGAALAQALAKALSFEPIAFPSGRSLAVVGPSGAGKTALVARLAVKAKLAGCGLRVLSTDMARAGGLAQLASLLQPLGIEPLPIDGGELQGVAAMADAATVTLIDTTGINPFRGAEVAELAGLLRAAPIEPVLVLPAGSDAEDAAEMARNFQALGARRLIVTKLDAARRLGGVLAAAHAGLALADCSCSPLIGKALVPLTAAGLARVLLHHGAANALGNAR